MLVPVFQMVLSEELQSLVRVMLQMAEVLTNMMDTILPAVGQLQTLMLSMNDINLMADPEFRDVCSLCCCTILYPQCICVCMSNECSFSAQKYSCDHIAYTKLVQATSNCFAEACFNWFSRASSFVFPLA